jgi:hypothetical protein
MPPELTELDPPDPKAFLLVVVASCSISLFRKSSNPDALLKPNFFAASAVLIAASSKSASKVILILILILLFVFHKAVLLNPTPVLRLSTLTRPG